MARKMRSCYALQWALLFSCLSTFALAQTANQPAPQPGQGELEQGVVLKRSYDFSEANRPEMEYALYVPSSYRAGEATPLIILLHGLGSNPQQVINYQGITENAEKHGYIVAAPYGYNERGWYGSRGTGNAGAPRPGSDASRSSQGSAAAAARSTAQGSDPENLGELSEKDVMNVLALVQEEFTIDPSGIYLMGHSMGGGGTLYLGMKHSDIWAALAPMAPAIWTSPDQLADIRDMPVILVQGENDTLVTTQLVRPWAKKMEELSMNHRYIEIPGGDHVLSISRNPEMIDEVFDFFNANRKQ